jgi:hypothetical protein
MKGRLAMTKKQFIALADVVRSAKPRTPNPKRADLSERWKGFDEGMHDEWEMMRDRLADFCASQNGKFDRARWLGYIAGDNGPNGGKVAQS